MRIANQRYEAAVPVSRLKKHPENAREGDVGLICESIEANGFYGACVVQESTGFIMVGNHRYEAALASEAGVVPVMWVDCDDATARRIMLVDNGANDKATNNLAKLSELLQSIADEDPNGLTGTGYDGDDLDEMIRDLARETDAAELANIAEEPSNPAPLLILKWPNNEVPMTESEMEGLTKALTEHVDTAGVPYGFVAKLLSVR